MKKYIIPSLEIEEITSQTLLTCSVANELGDGIQLSRKRYGSSLNDDDFEDEEDFDFDDEL